MQFQQMHELKTKTKIHELITKNKEEEEEAAAEKEKKESTKRGISTEPAQTVAISRFFIPD